MNKEDFYSILKEDYKSFNQECPNYIYLPPILPPTRRIIVIGDLHGDFDLTIRLLKLANLIDSNLDWIGNDTILVQTGDQIDRCRPIDNIPCNKPEATVNDEAADIKILKLFTKLNEQAIKYGGKVYSLLGNHEIMNVLGNLSYVSYKGLKEFENYIDPNNPKKKFRSGEVARRYAFSPGKEYGRYLGCTRLTAIIIGSFLFVHAGIIPKFAKKLKMTGRNDLVKINQIVRRWLLGLINKDYIDQIVKSYKYSLFWNRILGSIPPNVSNFDPLCVKYLDETLKLFKVKKMIIGHTPQYFINKEGINKTCGDKLWRVDIGGSAAFNKFDKEWINKGSITELRKVQVLEILDDSIIRIIK